MTIFTPSIFFCQWIYSTAYLLSRSAPNYLFLSWAKKNVGRSEDDVEEELIGYLSRKELTMIGLEEDYEYEKSLGYEAAWNSFYKAFSRICSDKRFILFGAFAATIALAEFLSPKMTSELPLAMVVNPSVGRGG